MAIEFARRYSLVSEGVADWPAAVRRRSKQRRGADGIGGGDGRRVSNAIMSSSPATKGEGRRLVVRHPHFAAGREI